MRSEASSHARDTAVAGFAGITTDFDELTV